MGALSVRDGGDHRSKKIAPIGMPKAGHWFVPDSPLEGGVSCELVSEVKFASRAPMGRFHGDCRRAAFLG